MVSASIDWHNKECGLLTCRDTSCIFYNQLQLFRIDFQYICKLFHGKIIAKIMQKTLLNIIVETDVIIQNQKCLFKPRCSENVHAVWLKLPLKLNVLYGVSLEWEKTKQFITLCNIQTGGLTFSHDVFQPPVNTEINISLFRHDAHTAWRKNNH